MGDSGLAQAVPKSSLARAGSGGGLSVSITASAALMLDPEGDLSKTQDLLCKVLVRIGEWQMSANEDSLERPVMEEVLEYLQRATELCPKAYKAWHAWGRMNSSMIDIELGGGKPQEDEQGDKGEEGGRRPPLSSPVPKQASITRYVVQAVRGFLRSIALCQDARQPVAYVLQDTLRLLTLWFKHGRLRGVHQEMEAGLDGISVATWLEVVPQLIARVDSSSTQIHSLLRRLLLKIGRAHPQALIYPITLAANSTSLKRRESASAILGDLRTHSPSLVDEAEMVSWEMINVALTRQELWHEGLEEASRLYFGEKNVSAAVAALEDLHKIGNGTR